MCLDIIRTGAYLLHELFHLIYAWIISKQAVQTYRHYSGIHHFHHACDHVLVAKRQITKIILIGELTNPLHCRNVNLAVACH